MTAHAVSVQSLCSLHNQTPATSACARCGTFICAAEGGRFCQSCAMRPEVTGPEAFRMKVWGRRDAWAWMLGGLALWSLLSLVRGLLAGEGNVSLLVVETVVCGLYWWGWRPMRLAIFIVPLLSGVPLILTAKGERDAVIGAVVAVLNSVPLVLAWFSTRNRLFFRMEVSPEALEKGWRRYMDKRIAYVALGLAFLGPCVPPLGFVSVPMWLSILVRANPVTGQPLVRRGFSVAGLLFACVASWVGFVAYYNFFSMRR